MQHTVHSNGHWSRPPRSARFWGAVLGMVAVPLCACASDACERAPA